MPRFLTGLVTTDYWRFPPFPYKARDWQFGLKRTKLSAIARERPGGGARVWTGREVVIDAPSVAVAERAAALLLNCSAVLKGADFSRIFEYQLELCDMANLRALPHDQNRQETRERRMASNIPVECLLTAKASSRSQLSYAITKLGLSYRLLSIPPIDLDPNHNERIPRSVREDEHVAFAYAIVAAYSAIEELGLEIRASSSRPSTIDGVWNPPVREDLEMRLSRAGVDLNERFTWSIRGGRARLERDRPPKVIRKSPWSRWQVRDGEVEVIDAIAHVSWLRSRVASHRTTPAMIRSLSVYDVTNAQFLARRLILEATGFWRNLLGHPHTNS